LKGFYYDLNYATKMKTEPTGHGYKTAAWSNEIVGVAPNPTPMHLTVQAGNVSFDDMLSSIDQGVIVCGALGAHSGNVTNGDFSIGLSPGIYVENGEVKGRIKNAMVAGNIYNIMHDIIAIEDTRHATHHGMFPALLLDNVSVATKN
jgi:PmbA protein